MNKEVFGAKAKIYIEYDGELAELGKILSKKLQIPEFWIKNDTKPPYAPIAMTEAFGFESWLNRTPDEKWNYEFEISTMHSLMETGTENMHDISEWLKRYIIDMCDINAQTEI